MNDKRTTPEFIDELIDSASEVKMVNTPPFFKDKVLNRLSQTREEKPVEFLNWFTPKYQVAALLMFVALNVVALYSYQLSSEEQELQTFAEAYGLSDDGSESILN